MALTLLVGDRLENFTILKEILKDNDHQVVEATSTSTAQNILTELTVDLLIVDEEIKEVKGMEFLKETVMKNPFINSAIVSLLSPEDFHEKSEGLGIIMQLSTTPSHEESCQLVEKVKKIVRMTEQSRSII